VAEPTPVERVVEEGGSEPLVKWVGRVQDHLPRLAPSVGFWASVYARFARHRGPVLAGGLAFFAALSLVPSVLSMAALVALVVDPTEFLKDLESVAGDAEQLVGWLQPILTAALSSSATSLGSLGVAGLVGLAVSLYAASRFVYVTRQVLDIAFDLRPEPPSVVWRGLAIVLTFVAMVATVAGVAVLAVVPRVMDRLGLQNIYLEIAQWLQVPLVMLAVYLLLTMAMRFGTRARRAVGWANLGALVGTLMAALGTVGLGWFLSVSVTYSQVVATLGSVIALELWLFVICTAIVVAAEIEGIRMGFVARAGAWADPVGRESDESGSSA
jgi:membrane protein